ncbi:MAG TPA: tripartite tricarboxylate transporter substrate binding protein [Ramlibacter sp.]|nr:tripartite tricarboxylate transporter substrate binding protein [Ramlibacter sp.]
MNLNRRQALLATCAAALPASAFPQESFPSRPVRVIVPLPAGATSDVGMRVLAKELSQLAGQPFIVENRPGGNNAIGAQAVLSAPPDGYTLLVGSNASMAANMAMLRRPGYDAINDFTPVGLMVNARWVMVVPASSPHATMEQLVAAAKREPKSMNAAASSSGYHLATALFARAAGVTLNVVPYKGTPPAFQDLIGGQVGMMVVDLSSALPLVASGRLRALGVVSDERLAVLPEVPTLKERGYGSTSLHSWAALFAPAKTPPATVQRLAVLLEQAMKTETYRRHAAETRSEATFVGPAPMAAFQKSQVEAYREAMLVAGIQAE